MFSFGNSGGDRSPKADDRTGVANGLIAGTKVATTIGWRTVENVVAGDKVLTFDNGMQEVLQVTRGKLWTADRACPRHLWPLRVPLDALGNAQELRMVPEQPVVVESDVGEELYGDPFTLIPAAALDGFRGITREEPVAEIEVVTLHFAQDQVVFASAGALFYCPSVESATMADMLHGGDQPYTILGREDAKFLLGCIQNDENQSSLQTRRAEARVA